MAQGIAERATMSKLVAMTTILMAIAPLPSFYTMVYHNRDVPNTDTNTNTVNNNQKDLVTMSSRYVEKKFKEMIAKVKHDGDGGSKRVHDDHPHDHHFEVENIRKQLQSSFDDLVQIVSRELRSSSSFEREGRVATKTTTMGGFERRTLSLRRGDRWTLALPWLLSLFFGVVLPLARTISRGPRRRRPRRRRLPVADIVDVGRVVANDDDDDDDGAGRRRYSPCTDRRTERRRASLESALEDFSVTLTKDDFVDEEKDNGVGRVLFHRRNKHKRSRRERGFADADDALRLILPAPGTTTSAAFATNHDSQRVVHGECAICLARFEEGEVVAWSSNHKCQHVFHKSCVVAWFSRKRRSFRDCPCCRQLFVDPSIIVNFSCSYDRDSRFSAALDNHYS